MDTQQLINYVNHLRAEQEQLAQLNKQLLSSGWIGQVEGYGLPCLYWKDGKYLVLRFPSTATENRPVRYIGAAPEVVRYALAGYERQKKYQLNTARMEAIAAALHHAECQLALVTIQLKSVLNCQQALY